MSWQCFVDRNTGQGYKSKRAAANSTNDLDNYEFTLTENELQAFGPLGSWYVGQDYMEKTTGRIPCDKHEVLPTGIRHLSRLSPSAPQDLDTDGAAVLIVWLDRDTLLPTPTRARLMAKEDWWRDYVDSCRQREADMLMLEGLRRIMTEKLKRSLMFVFAYGDESKLRVVEELNRRRQRFSVTSKFNSMSDFLLHLKYMKNAPKLMFFPK